MIFNKLPLQDAYVIEPELIEDIRGFYARALCEKEFADHGMALNIVQSNISFSKKTGTLRGLHYQVAPHLETKIVRCTQGAIYDVIIDMREDSPTYKQWHGEELTSENRKTLYIPGGFAQGFITLQDDSEVSYNVTEFYHPESERGLRYNDPAFGVEWPIAPVVMSDKDCNCPDFNSL